MPLGPDIARIAGLIGEPARAAILAALVDGRALPAGELAFIGNIAPPTASFHLRKLVEASLVTVQKQGKHAYYRLTDERVATALESIAALAPMRRQAGLRIQARQESESTRQLRFARSCYRHLAGVLAVEIDRALLDRGFLSRESGATYRLTDEGRRWSRQLGLALQTVRSNGASGKVCLDWTERRPHIGGPLGVAIFSRLTELGWIARIQDTRALRLTHAGARALEKQFGINTTFKSQSRSTGTILVR